MKWKWKTGEEMIGEGSAGDGKGKRKRIKPERLEGAAVERKRRGYKT